jgi:hypothetical protein
MKEQFDKKLAEKIKASFEHHEETFDPKEWEKLSTAYFKPKKGLAKAPWLVWAASMVAVLGLGLLFFNLNKNSEISSSDELATTNVITPESSAIPTPSIEPIIESDTAEKKEKEKISEEKFNTLTGSEQRTYLYDLITNIPKVEKTIALEPAKEPIITQNGKDQKPEILEDNIPIKSEVVSPFVAQLKEQEEQDAKAAISAWLQEGKETDEEKEKPYAAPVKLGVVVAPQAVANSNQSLNLGGGLASEFSFSKRLKLDVGMVYASQNLNPSNSNFNSLMMQSSVQDDGSRLSALNTNVVNATTELRFGQLEIPLNLKYMIMDKKSAGLYVISGLSNMFFLNQRTVSTFSAVNMNTAGLAIGQHSVQTFTQTLRPEPGSDGGNVGQLINFGFGYEHSLNNGTFISVEPFYKTSLGGQTFLGQQLSIGGLNLRMNFQLKK